MSIPKDKLDRLFKDIKRDFPCHITKMTSGDKIYITLPPKEIHVPVNPNQAKNYDDLEKVVSLAQRLATSMVREMTDGLVDRLVGRISEGILDTLGTRIPLEEKIIVRETVREVAQKAKEEFRFKDETPVTKVDYAGNLQLVGNTGESVGKKDDISESLDKLKGLSI